MTLHNHFHSFLDEVHREGRYRVFTDLERHAERPPYAIWRCGDISREVVVWCSNDYLGMGRHPAVIDAMVETARRMGAGAGGTRNISGNSHAVVALEAELADRSSPPNHRSVQQGPSKPVVLVRGWSDVDAGMPLRLHKPASPFSA